MEAYERLTVREVHQWLLDTTRHVMHIEYFLERLQIGSDDPERPHDIIGVGNKFEWDVVRGLALQYLPRGEKIYKTEIDAALAIHRQQYHHLQWNFHEGQATDDALGLGAVDAVCSLLENRPYQGGKHSFPEIRMIATRNSVQKQHWINEISEEMQRMKRPLIEHINSLVRIPNIGIDIEKYELICQRVQETMNEAEGRGFRVRAYDGERSIPPQEERRVQLGC